MATDIEVRQRIIAFAQDRFLNPGFSKVTLDEIASELGMSKKTLYKYFENKEDILRYGMQETMRAIAEEIDHIVVSDRPFAEKLAGMMMVIGKQVLKLSRSAQSDMRKFTPELWKEIEVFRREQIFMKMGKMISQAREENIFRPDVNEQVLVLMILNCVQGILNPEVLSQNSFSAEQAFRIIFKTIFEGALTDGARKDFHLFDTPAHNF
jgi:AcrR family transcriptional regulator